MSKETKIIKQFSKFHRIVERDGRQFEEWVVDPNHPPSFWLQPVQFMASFNREGVGKLEDEA